MTATARQSLMMAARHLVISLCISRAGGLQRAHRRLEPGDLGRRTPSAPPASRRTICSTVEQMVLLLAGGARGVRRPRSPGYTRLCARWRPPAREMQSEIRRCAAAFSREIQIVSASGSSKGFSAFFIVSCARYCGRTNERTHLKNHPHLVLKLSS